MRSVILLVVGAAWVAVLLPPLLRSRLENRPGSSIDSFQSRLSSLQRSVPSTGMRSMARPLAGSQRHDLRYSGVRPVDVRYAPLRVGSGRQRSAQRTTAYASPAHRAAPSNIPQRFDLRGARQMDHNTRQFDRRAMQSHTSTGLQRRNETRSESRHRQTTVPNRHRATVKQRRQNVLFLLILATALSGMFVAVANNTTSKASLAVTACALVGYTYLLAQMRRADQGNDDYYGYEAA